MNLEGDISEIQLVERLVDLWREQFTGAIRFENDGIIKIIYFKGGDVLSASTNDRADSIDEILMRAGKVSREHVKQALAKRKENETLGDALLNLGFITRKELTWARRVQVVGVIRSIAAWPTGTFTIVADYLPKRDEGTLFPLPQVLVELVVTEADRQRFERAMDGGAAVFARSADFDDVFRRLGLNEEADTIVAQIDGFNTAAEIALASGKDTFNVYKLLDALALLRILQRATKPQATPELSLDSSEGFASAGVADAADMWDDAPPAAIGSEIGGGPDFQLDETEAYASPTLEVPGLSMPPESDYQPTLTVDDPEPDEPAWGAQHDETPAWDEVPLEPVPSTTVPLAAMPVWDKAPPPIAPPGPIVKQKMEPAEQWGFDEAQLDAARRADVPVATTPAAASPALKRGKPARSGAGRYGLLIALMVIFVLAGAGYFGFLWWQGQQNAQVVAQQPVRRAPRRPVVPAPTGTIVESPTVDTAATDTTVTTTAPPAGLTITTPAVTASEPPPPVTATTAPPPLVATATTAPVQNVQKPTPVPAAATPAEAQQRARYDAMARDYAASPSGNYTVQFAIFCQPSSVANAIKSGGGKVWFVKYGGRCYQAYYGNFDSRDDAVAAMANLPRSLQDANAKVVAIAR